MIRDTDVFIILGVGFFSLILLYIKAYLHFLYLKEKGKFCDIDSLFYFVFRPWSAFEYLPELFVITWVPIFTIKNRNFLHNSIAILSYTIILLWLFLIVYNKAIS